MNPYQQLLVQELRARGVSVDEEAPSLRRSRADGVHLQNIRRFLTFRGTWRSLARCACFILRLLYERSQGVRIVWTVHDLRHPVGRHPLLDRAITYALARVAHALIVHGAAAQAEVAAAARLKDQRKFHVVPIGHFAGRYENAIARDEARARLNVDDDAFVFLFFGWMRRYKGVLELIRAFREMRGERLILLLAGAAPEPDYTETVRRAAEADPRIRLRLESIPEAEVQLYLNACNVVVFPYERVLASGAVPVAATFGKPCILADHGGLQDAVSRDRGVFFEPDGGLRDALAFAAGNRERLAEMGRQSRIAALQWGWAEVAEATLAVYRSVSSR